MRIINRLLHLIAAFLVPHSQALINNPLAATTNTPGYHCRIHNDLHMINIHYGSSRQGLPCKVTYQQSSKDITQLLEARRNVNICKNKAERMAIRLEDRGWNCKKVELRKIHR